MQTEGLNIEGYARLKADKKAWEEELKERKELEGTINGYTQST